jgi:hypothetical protein
MEGQLIERAHRQSVQASVAEVVGYLRELLSRRLVAYIAGVKDAKTVTRWASGEIENVRDENEKRLRTAYEIAQLLVRFDSPRVVKAWFIGLNPQLGDTSPAEAIHDGDLKEAMSAARAFVAGG